MVELFKVLGVVALLVVAAAVLAVAMAMRALVRANRVTPGRRGRAPLSWLVSLGAAARLHRRLRSAVGATELAVSLVPAAAVLRGVADDLVDRAVTLDDWLVAADRLHPAARRPRMRQLTAEVKEVEVSAARLHQLSGQWHRSLDQATAPLDATLPDWHQRLDAVEATLREL